NSDDPSYFGGYIAENYHAAQSTLNLSRQDIYQLAKNSFSASFLPEADKLAYLDELDQFMAARGAETL
ncbi:MAG: adenosine deaminase, partial [Pseudanabaena sp.]